MKNFLLYSLALVTIFSFVIISCQKNSSDNSTTNNKAKLQIYLTDAPGDFEAVYIDVKDVRINFTADSVNGWQSLSGVHAGVYDLLKLVNDDDTLLADADIPSGRIHQLRLILGTENYVKIEGTAQQIKLETPSAQQSGLKLNIQQDVVGGVLYKLLLDFDVAKSIHKTGNNKYMLKPVIRTVLQAIGGSIKGVVMPKSFQSAIYAVQGPDTIASTFTGSNGGYFFKGLAAGTYALHYHPSDITYKDSIRNNISVSANMVTVVDTTLLHQ
jgi:hypothetical protein